MMRMEKRQPTQRKPAGLIADGLDRRVARRYYLTWSVRIKNLDRSGCRFSETGELQNLSSTGAAVNMGRFVQAGARLEVFIRLPLQPERWIRYFGKVLRVQSAHSQAEVAIRFDSSRPIFVRGILP